MAFDNWKEVTISKSWINEQSKELPEINFEKDKRGLIGVYEDTYWEKI